MHCIPFYHDYLVRCPQGVYVNAVGIAGPYAALRWQITDKFDNEYTGEVITNGTGGFTIPTNELPDGLLNAFAGNFTLRVLDVDNDCRPVPILVAGYYDAISFEIKGGSRVKDTLGCPFDVVLQGGGGGSARNSDNFTADGTQTAFQTDTAFIPGNEDVFVGGLLYTDGVDYSITGPNTITFPYPPDAGVKIKINYFS